jgi:hypothetical protein
MQDNQTTRAALVAVITFAVITAAKYLHLELPAEVRDGVVVLILAYGLHRAADSKPKG